MNNFFRITGCTSLLCTIALTVSCSNDDVRDLPNTVTAAQQLTNNAVDVRSFDVYKDGEMMHLFSAESRPPAKTVHLYHRSSADEGASWSSPVQVNDAAHPPHKPHRGNDIQIAAAGNSLVAAWTIAGTGFMGSGPLATAVSKDGGQSWQPGAKPGDKSNTAGHGFADVIAHGNGFDMVWLDSRMDKQGLRHARSSDGGTSWSKNVTLDARTCECCWNSLASVADGNLYALYRGLTPRDMLLTSSRDGENWKQLGSVGKFDWKINACPHNGGGLAILPGQTKAMHAVVWTGKEDARGVFHVMSADAGKTWSKPARIGDDKSQHPDIAITPAGYVAIVWDGRKGDNEGDPALAVISNQNGEQWSPVWRLSAPDVNVLNPRIVSSGKQFRTFWTQGDQERGHVLMTRELPAE